MKKVSESSTSTGILPVPLFNPDVDVEMTRRNLPHWRQDGKTYFVTFRLADSLPREKRVQLQTDRDAWRSRHGDTLPSELDASDRVVYYRLFHQRVEEWLDAGDGSCVLRDPAAAKIVSDALHFFDGKRYTLGEWTVAGNHVHVIVTPAASEKLSVILHSWKSFTAKEVNKFLGCSGTFWLDENFDHLVRSEAQLRRFEEYIQGHV